MYVAEESYSRHLTGSCQQRQEKKVKARPHGHRSGPLYSMSLYSAQEVGQVKVRNGANPAAQTLLPSPLEEAPQEQDDKETCLVASKVQKRS